MKRFLILTLTAAVFAVALLAGTTTSAQSSSTTTNTASVTAPTPIHWRLVPGALYRTENGMGLSVACQVTSRDADFTGRPSTVMVRLKIQQPPQPDEGRPHWTDVWNWNSHPVDPARGFRPCNLAKGVDLVEWDHISFRDGLLELGTSPALIETLRAVVRYYRPERGYPDHNGLHLRSQYGNFLNGYIDLVNNNTESPTAAAEDAVEFGFR